MLLSCLLPYTRAPQVHRPETVQVANHLLARLGKPAIPPGLCSAQP